MLATISPRPASSDAPAYLIGLDGDGRWVALVGRRHGGLFRTREAATRYVCGELGCRPAEVAVSTDPVILRLS